MVNKLELPKDFFRKDGQLFQKLKFGTLTTNMPVREDTLKSIINGNSNSLEAQKIQKELNPDKDKIWFTNFEGNKKRLYIDKKLKRVLDNGLKRIRGGFDFVCIICGSVGGGKSTIAFSTIAPYLDKNFTESNIVFSAEEFIKRANELPDESSIIVDESFNDMNNRSTAKNSYLKLVNFMTLIRQKRMKIILILPDFFDLSKYMAISRSNLLVVTYSDKKTYERGKFLLFDSDKKKQLYIKGRKFLNYSVVGASFRGKFQLNPNLIDEKTYIKRKRDHLMSQDEKNENVDISKFDRDKIIYQLRTEYEWKQKDLAKLFKIDRSQISRVCKILDIESKRSQVKSRNTQIVE